MQTIWVFGNLLDASHGVSLLQAEGFDAVLLDEDAFLNGYGPIRLQVPEQQVADAVELLKSFRDATPELVDDLPGDPPAEA